MSLIQNQEGVTLIELLVAVVILSVGVIILSAVFPRMSRNVAYNRNRLVAGNFASGRMEEIKQQTYALIPLTASTQFGSTPDCNCTLVNMSTLSTDDAVLIDGGTKYTRKLCIHLVEPVSGGTWNSYCPDNTSQTDKGMKNIRIQVIWKAGTSTKDFTMESMVAR